MPRDYTLNLVDNITSGVAKAYIIKLRVSAPMPRMYAWSSGYIGKFQPYGRTVWEFSTKFREKVVDLEFYDTNKADCSILSSLTAALNYHREHEKLETERGISMQISGGDTLIDIPLRPDMSLQYKEGTTRMDCHIKITDPHNELYNHYNFSQIGESACEQHKLIYERMQTAIEKLKSEEP